jgi:hypothetical protein
MLSQFRSHGYTLDSVATAGLGTTTWFVTRPDSAERHEVGLVIAQANEIVQVTRTVDNPARPALLAEATLLASTILIERV